MKATNQTNVTGARASVGNLKKFTLKPFVRLTAILLLLALLTTTASAGGLPPQLVAGLIQGVFRAITPRNNGNNNYRRQQQCQPVYVEHTAQQPQRRVVARQRSTRLYCGSTANFQSAAGANRCQQVAMEAVRRFEYSGSQSSAINYIRCALPDARDIQIIPGQRMCGEQERVVVDAPQPVVHRQVVYTRVVEDPPCTQPVVIVHRPRCRPRYQTTCVYGTPTNYGGLHYVQYWRPGMPVPR
jgi:hypothetical protein